MVKALLYLCVFDHNNYTVKIYSSNKCYCYSEIMILLTYYFRLIIIKFMYVCLMLSMFKNNGIRVISNSKSATNGTLLEIILDFTVQYRQMGCQVYSKINSNKPLINSSVLFYKCKWRNVPHITTLRYTLLFSLRFIILI